MGKLKIALLDDEKDLLETLSGILGKRGYSVSCFESPEAFLNQIPLLKPHIAFLDINLGTGRLSGLEVLARLRKEHPETASVVISGSADIKKAVEAIKLGARDFIEKPLRAAQILDCIAEVESRVNLGIERDGLLSHVLSQHEIIGQSETMRGVRETIRLYADLNEPVLITGESGTGKELIAANLHYLSRRRPEKYYKINVASIPDSLIEDQLFGHLKGSFSGADKSRDGILAAAGSSTLFLDEIGELKLELQPKLLRAVQEREIIPIGSNEARRVEARLVFATNRDLSKSAGSGAFRADLFYRISALTIEAPPLRSRAEDIPLLAARFLADFCAENNLQMRELSAEALDKLRGYRFPGNVRELRNVLIKAAATARDPQRIMAEDIHFQGTASRALLSKAMPLKKKKTLLEKKYIEAQLRKNGFDMNKTAEGLGILVNNLYRKIHALGIQVPGIRRGSGG